MAQYRLNIPLSEADVRQLRAGDSVILDGIIYGIRDATLIHIFDYNEKPPVDLRGGVLLHTAPNVKKVGDKYEPVCIGTTTSTRMDRFTGGLLHEYGVRAIIGKGGLYEKSTQLLKEYGGVYLAVVGGAASVETVQIEEIEAVYYENLMPECLWQFRVKNFGPLTVAIDSHGNNLYFDVKAKAQAALPGVYEELGVKA